MILLLKFWLKEVPYNIEGAILIFTLENTIWQSGDVLLPKELVLPVLYYTQGK